MHGALAQAFAHQGELAGFEIAQPSMDQFAGAARGAAGETTFLYQQGAMPGRGGGLQHAGAMDAAADDDDVEFFHVTFVALIFG